MRSWVVIVCVGAILVAAFFPGAVALCTPLTQRCDITAGIDGSMLQRVGRSPSVAPALLALIVSHHLPRASLLAARS
jgi:hypothetical protein